MGDNLLDFVVSVGAKLRRSEDDVAPYHKILEDNWYDSVDILADAKPEQLVTLGIPLRFANALVETAASGGAEAPSRSEKGKGKGKSKGKKRSKRDDDYPRKGRDNGEVSRTIDLDEVDSGFNMKGKLLGHKGQNVHHIQDETACKVFIDSDCRTMEITAQDRSSLDRACDMCHDLIRVSYEDYEAWLASDDKSSSDGKGKSKGKDRKGDKDKGKKGKGKGKDSNRNKDGGAYKETIDLERCDKRFYLRGKILGEGGKNIFYIQDQSQTQINVEDDGQDVRVHVSGETTDSLAQAVQMTKDLIGTVMEEYDSWLADQEDGGQDADDLDGGSKGSKKGKRKGKGKGKGKRKGYDDDGPPSKRFRS